MDTNQNVEVTAEQIKELLDSGMTKTMAGEELGISAQKVGMILKAAEKEAENTGAVLADSELVDEVPPSVFAKEYGGKGIVKKAHITIMTTAEYAEYSEANDRYYGRKRGEKTICTIEELRALINSGWKPSMVMRKHGIDADEFQQLVWKLSKAELRDRPLKFSIEQDFIEKG